MIFFVALAVAFISGESPPCLYGNVRQAFKKAKEASASGKAKKTGKIVSSFIVSERKSAPVKTFFSKAFNDTANMKNLVSKIFNFCVCRQSTH